MIFSLPVMETNFSNTRFGDRMFEVIKNVNTL